MLNFNTPAITNDTARSRAVFNINAQTALASVSCKYHMWSWWLRCGFSGFGLFERVIVGVGARPTAAGLFKVVASQAPGASMSDDPGGLIRQKCCRINNLGFQGDFLANMFTAGYFDYFPISISHRLTSVGELTDKSKSIIAYLKNNQNLPLSEVIII